MIRGTLVAAFGLVVAVGCAPRSDLPLEGASPIAGNLAGGETLFRVGGCASCHATPGSEQQEVPRLGGGRELHTRYGTFRAPNISPDETHGIGAWTARQFANAMLRGVSPDGRHYYPVFPYTSYGRMSDRDVAKIWTYLRSLPPVPQDVDNHDLRFPYNKRGAMVLWKPLFFRPGKVVDIKNPTPEVRRGQYLVEGPGHCGECHTPRDRLGGLKHDRWLAGGLLPDAGIFAPNITTGVNGTGNLTTAEILTLLKPVSPRGETFAQGFEMEAVRRNLAALPKSDRRAIAAYLKAVPALPAPGLQPQDDPEDTKGGR